MNWPFVGIAWSHRLTLKFDFGPRFPRKKLVNALPNYQEMQLTKNVTCFIIRVDCIFLQSVAADQKIGIWDQ